ncbi:MAG: dihydroorotate dehydrogenase electron transfer subunit [Candidatus Aenigmarchaeota archaeon]
MSELPEIARIEKIVQENPYVKTFFFDREIDPKPGQFVMVWIPGLDEKPFSMSYTGKETGITVERKGKFTEKLFSMKAGDSVGLRGPYGNGFIPKANACVVAGGCGIAPLSPLIGKLKNPFVILGARSKDRLIFEKRFNAKVTTDDGSFGEKGFTTDVLENALKDKKFEVVYTCGPEVMMRKVFEICEREGIECQASLERYMKCGFGVCGQCEINGFRMCKDGPVFFPEQLREMGDFGKEARLKTGKKVPVSEYVQWRCV